MFQFKRSGRLTALVLALCLLVALIPSPAGAVSAEEPVMPEPPQQEEKAPERTVAVVHRYPYFSSLVIGCLEDGTKVTVLGETVEFYRVDCYDMVGYIAKEQLTLMGDTYYVNCVADSSETKALSSTSANEALAIRGQIREFASRFLGVPYVSGGTSPWGFDCSGLTQYVFRNFGYEIERTVAGQLNNGVVIAKEDLKAGDLVFFQNTTGWGHFASHVGVYIGNGQIIHAGDGGVGVADLDHPYFVQHYMCARRVILSDLAVENILPVLGIGQNMNSSYWRESSQTTESGNFFYPGVENLSVF